MLDTSSEAAQVHLAIVSALDGNARLRQAFELSETTRALAMARLRATFPDASERRLVELLLQERVPKQELPPHLR